LKPSISSGCGKGITFTSYRMYADQRINVAGPLVDLDDIKRLLNTFRNISRLYLETGGVHSAALSDGRDILFFSEDIGRHNAVDKLIGKAFLQSVSVENKILLTSGRVTSEIVTKAGRNRFPILISRAAPSCMAISYAEDMGHARRLWRGDHEHLHVAVQDQLVGQFQVRGGFAPPLAFAVNLKLEI
jgi:FdhD protein